MAMRDAVEDRTGAGKVAYTATISSTPLRLRESRIVAGLLLQGMSDEAWTAAIVDNNALQIASKVGVVRSANILRARLEPLGQELWRMVRDGGRELATQAAMAGAIKHSRLLGDFMDLAIRDQRALFHANVDRRTWSEYLEGCRGRDLEMPHWSDTTVAKLRSVVFSMLAEAGYLKDTRSLQLQTVFVDDQLANYLTERGESYVLRCLRVME
ncbi:MAG: DUF1819 family protein [Planctomycetota bacterium]